MRTTSRSQTVFRLTSLTEEVYDNPFMIFQKAFDEKTLEQFELFLSKIVCPSVSPQEGDPEADDATCYIHLSKMFDAVELIRKRGVEKIRKTHQILREKPKRILN